MFIQSSYEVCKKFIISPLEVHKKFVGIPQEVYKNFVRGFFIAKQMPSSLPGRNFITQHVKRRCSYEVNKKFIRSS